MILAMVALAIAGDRRGCTYPTMRFESTLDQGAKNMLIQALVPTHIPPSTNDPLFGVWSFGREQEGRGQYFAKKGTWEYDRIRAPSPALLVQEIQEYFAH